MARDRVVVLVDMDCFYVQVEQRANPDLKGKPCAVVQYKKWKGGGLVLHLLTAGFNIEFQVVICSSDRTNEPNFGKTSVRVSHC